MVVLDCQAQLLDHQIDRAVLRTRDRTDWTGFPMFWRNLKSIEKQLRRHTVGSGNMLNAHPRPD